MQQYYSNTRKYIFHNEDALRIQGLERLISRCANADEIKVELDKVRDKNTGSYTPWTYLAAKHGCLSLMKWLDENDYSPDEWTVGVAIEFNQIDILRYLDEQKFLHKDKYFFLIRLACKSGSIKCLKYYVENTSVKNEADGDSSLRVSICMDIATASKRGYARENVALSIFKYLVENGFVFDKPCYFHFMSRESGSDLCLLKYIHEEMNCEWDETWAERASQNGNLYALKYLHENGCPWNEDTCVTKYLECLKYAHENGCPWGSRSYGGAFNYFNIDMIEYLTEHGCPINKGMNTLAFLAGVIRAWGKGVQCTNYAWEGGGTAHITLFHDLLKGCVKYFVSTQRYIDVDLLQTNDTASTLHLVSQCLCDNCFDCFCYIRTLNEGLDEDENVEYVLVFLRDTVGLKFDTSLITYLLKYGNWKTTLELLDSYSTPYDVENILHECDDDDSIDAFKEWLEENNEEEYIKYFDNTTKKDVMKIQELIDEEKENISNGLFVMMNELLKKIYENC